MKMCYLIHGIKTQDAERSTISFLQYLLTGFRTKIVDYGYVPAIAAPIISLLNRCVVKKLADQIRPRQILIGHSNGCAVAYALSNKMPVHGLVLINPALDCDVKFNSGLKFVHVYWSKKDRVTWLSKFVPFSQWGSMGTEGYTGDDPRVKQWEMDVTHTDIGSAEIALKWGPLIATNLTAAVAESHQV